MYEAFDGFLLLKTWDLRHTCDERAFFSALKRVIANSEFDPDAMGRYLSEHAIGLNNEALDKAVDHYVAAGIGG
jgi:hypothetical protein